MTKCCTACGQTLPDPLPVDLPLRGMQAAIVRHVHAAGRHGIPTDILFNRLYDDNADGGPLSGVRTLYVHIYAINRKLALIGKRIQSGGTGRGTLNYTLINTGVDHAQGRS